MVCEKCEKKLGVTATPDPWKQGCRNAIDTNSVSKQDNKQLQTIGKIKTLSSSKLSSKSTTKTVSSSVMYSFGACRICKQKVHEPGRHYCQSCAYKKVAYECIKCSIKIPTHCSDDDEILLSWRCRCGSCKLCLATFYCHRCSVWRS